MSPKNLNLPAYVTHPDAKAYWASINNSRAPGEFVPEPTSTIEKCATCGGAGFIRRVYTRDGQVVGSEYVRCDNVSCETVRSIDHNRYRTITASSRIPEQYAKMTLSHWHTLMKKQSKGKVHPMDGKRDAFGAALAFINAYDKNFRFTRAEAASEVNLPPPLDEDKAKLNSIVYAGLNGVGKTSLACAIANALMDMQIGVVYVQMADFFMSLRASFGDGKGKTGKTESGLMKQYQDAPVLVIDEFPAYTTEWQKQMGALLINHRSSNALPTIITTNILTPEALTVAWEHLIGDRIAAMAHWFVVGGIELRRRKAARESR